MSSSPCSVKKVWIFLSVLSFLATLILCLFIATVKPDSYDVQQAQTAWQSGNYLKGTVLYGFAHLHARDREIRLWIIEQYEQRVTYPLIWKGHYHAALNYCPLLLAIGGPYNVEGPRAWSCNIAKERAPFEVMCNDGCTAECQSLDDMGITIATCQ